MTLNYAQLIGGPDAGGLLDGFRNRIINGDMRIDQRNNGASITPAIGNNVFPVDRYFAQNISGTTTYSVQQSSTAPAGFSNSVVITTITSGSPAAADSKALFQFIEGYNVADLALGTAAAKSFTLSFWVRSSVTGNFGVGLASGDGSRSYSASYTISAANTWEYKTITVPGDTTGTYATDNTAGMRVGWNIGSGSNYHGTLNTWGTVGGGRGAFSGVTSLLATAGATLYITGVQLEAGEVASDFQRRSYGQELALCQRYYQRIDMTKTPTVGDGSSGANVTCRFTAIQTMRGTPTGSIGGTFATRINGSDSTQSSQSASGEDSSTATVYIINQNIGGVAATYSSSTQIKSGVLILSSEL